MLFNVRRFTFCNLSPHHRSHAGAAFFATRCDVQGSGYIFTVRTHLFLKCVPLVSTSDKSADHGRTSAASTVILLNALCLCRLPTHSQNN
eukprot:6477261-Amphidinium_carterae.3